MTKLLRLLPFLCLYFLLAIRVHAEEIHNFTTGILIRTDGSVDLSEYIKYDFGSASRHGIFRNIPFIKTNQDGKKYILDFQQVFVQDEQQTPYRFSRESEDGMLSLKIGDPDRTITGLHLYNIRYRVSGALTYFSDHDELYWNITGNDWQVPIGSATADIRFAPEVDLSKIQVACFTGLQGSTQSNCDITLRDGGILVTTGLLSAGEGLTAAVSFPKNLVAVREPKEYISFWDTTAGKILAAIIAIALTAGTLLWYIGFPVFIIYRWWHFGRDPRPPMGVTSAWFDVPKGKNLRPLTPGETGTLVDETADVRDVTATIVDLARRGYIKITEQKKNDFSLKKLKDYKDNKELRPHEKVLMEGLFGALDFMRIKGAHLDKTVTDTKTQLYDETVTEGFFTKSPQKIRTLYYVIAGIALFTANIPLAIIAFFFGRAMPAKTAAGSQTAAVALSLKNFLSSQKKKLEFQAKNQMFFEKLLPYAVAFGVEKVWAERFADIQMKQPDWYEGYNRSAFNSIVFANALSSSFHSSVVSAATPTRSSSGFSSGFGGGGFSGGGGGGGGGGSW